MLSLKAAGKFVVLLLPCCTSTNGTAHLFRLSLYGHACPGSRLLVLRLKLTTGYVAAQTGSCGWLHCRVLPRPLNSERHWILCRLRTVKAVLLALFCLYLHRPATSAATVFPGGKPAHRRVRWLAAPGDTGKLLQRSAHSTVAM